MRAICSNSWLSLMQTDSGYVFAHETRCDGEIVAILPYRKKMSKGVPFYQYLFRAEWVPCWKPSLKAISFDDEPNRPKFTTIITGGIEDNDTASKTAQKELREEAGFDAPIENLIYLGSCAGTKSVDTIYHLYAIDVDSLGVREVDIEGDGTENEKHAYCYWTDTVEHAVDPIAYTLYYKLNLYLNRRA